VRRSVAVSVAPAMRAAAQPFASAAVTPCSRRYSR
jgi:hypothetical protein